MLFLSCFFPSFLTNFHDFLMTSVSSGAPFWCSRLDAVHIFTFSSFLHRKFTFERFLRNLPSFLVPKSSKNEVGKRWKNKLQEKSGKQSAREHFQLSSGGWAAQAGGRLLTLFNGVSVTCFVVLSTPWCRRHRRISEASPHAADPLGLED